MKKTFVLIGILSAVLLLGFGFALEVRADQWNGGSAPGARDPAGFGPTSLKTTQKRYNNYLKTQKRISKLETKLSGTTDPAKAARLEKRIDRLTTKTNNIQPAVAGLKMYQKKTATLNRLETKLQVGGLTQKQIQRISHRIDKLQLTIPKLGTKAQANELKQYDKIQNKITALETKALNNPAKAPKIQNRIDRLQGQANWLKSTTSNILGR